MPTLFSSRHITSVLQKHGFMYISQKGSHANFRKISGKNIHTVVVPATRKEIPFGTFRSIVRQSGLDIKDFDRK